MKNRTHNHKAAILFSRSYPAAPATLFIMLNIITASPPIAFTK